MVLSVSYLIFIYFECLKYIYIKIMVTYKTWFHDDLFSIGTETVFNMMCIEAIFLGAF